VDLRRGSHHALHPIWGGTSQASEDIDS
jgi:hypothetical protein